MSSDHGKLFVKRSPMPVSAEDLFAWHARPGAFERLTPPWESIRIAGAHPGLVEGAEVVLRLGRGPLRFTWVARHRDILPGRAFTDEQIRGPFARWVHLHRFEPDGPGASVLEDRIEYRLPLGGLGHLAAGPMVRRALDRSFTFRHRRTREDLVRHRDAALPRPLRVAVTGASGLVGSALAAFLRTGGHEVVPILRRTPRPGEPGIVWDPDRGALDAAALEGFDAVVHLAGANIGESRWTPARKEILRRSRVDATGLLCRALAALDRPPRVLVSASAVGYYGDRGEEPVDEEAPAGKGFLAELAQAWEAAAGPARAAGIRVVHPRIGVVLAGQGGMLARLAPIFAAGGGAVLGHGRQRVSWIALDDLLGVILAALADERVEGPVNAVAPRSATQEEFSRALGRALRRPVLLRAPGAVIRAAMGEMGKALVLEGADVRPARLQDLGFRHLRADLDETLRLELGRYGSA